MIHSDDNTIVIHSVEGLKLETSVLESFTVANLRYWQNAKLRERRLQERGCRSRI